MEKLTDQQLDRLVRLKNKKGVEVVEVMTLKELEAYRINCTDAIAKRESDMVKTKSVTMRNIMKETIDILNGYIEYIDNKLENRNKMRIHVWFDIYLKLWTIQKLDLIGNQIDQAEYEHYKKDAVIVARSYNCEVLIFKQNGELQK